MLARRPLFCVLASFAAGIALASYEIAPYPFVCLAAAVAFALSVPFFRKHIRLIALSAAAAVVGCAYCGSAIVSNRDKAFMRERSASVTATVVKVLDSDTFLIGNVYANGEELEGNCLLYASNIRPALPGQIVRLENAQVRSPSAVPTASRFRGDTYAMSQGAWYSVIGSITDVSGEAGFLFGRIQSFSNTLAKRIDSICPTDAELVKALLIGRRDGIGKEVNLAFSRAGIAHVLSVSGLHVGFFVMMLNFVLKRLPVSRRARAMTAMLIMAGYCLVVGMIPSVVRATIMAIVVLSGDALGRKTDIITSLLIAAALILIHNPLSVFSSGFVMSFVSVLGIAVLYERLEKRLRFLGRFISQPVALTLSAQTLLLPLLIVYYSQIPILSLVTNPFLVPLASFAVMFGIPVALLSLILPESLMLYIAAPLNASAMALRLSAQWFSSLPFAVLSVHTPWMAVTGLYFAAAALLSAGRRRLALGVSVAVIAIGIYFFQPVVWRGGGFRVTVFNVGNADAIYLAGDRSGVLVDCALNSAQMGRALAQRALCAEVLIITHGHDDHGGGLTDVINYGKVKEIRIWGGSDESLFGPETRAGLKLARETGIPIKSVYTGDVFTVDGIRFTVLAPVTTSDKDENENSLVMLAEYGGHSVLLTGDTVSKIEKTLPDMNVDLLKVAHHGSATSTSQAFLKRVSAGLAAISVSDNFYALPFPAVIERLEERNIETCLTRDMGTIKITFDGGISASADP